MKPKCTSRWVAAIASCCGAAVCGCAPEPPIALYSVTIPAVVRAGSPVQVHGRGLAGAKLRLVGALTDIDLVQTDSRADGSEIATGNLPLAGQWRSGQRFGGACLVGHDWSGWQACVAVDCRFRTDWRAGSMALATTTLAWGAPAQVAAEDLLLPGEGEMAVDVDNGITVTSAQLTTNQASGRGLGTIGVVAPHWTGVTPGLHQWRLRLRGSHAGQPSNGPWTATIAVTLATPTLGSPAGPSPTLLRRGDKIPLMIAAVAPGAELLVGGDWLPASTGAAPIARAWQLQALAITGPATIVPSAWYLTQVQPMLDLGARRLLGSARLRVANGSDHWLSAPLAVDWQPKTIQRIELVCDDGWDAALQRLGLLAVSAQVRLRLLSYVRGFFGGLPVQIEWRTAVPMPGEVLSVHFLDRDPNGLGLFGAEAGAAKDVGNRDLGETLGGLNTAAHAAGLAAYGGIFAGEILGFSRKLQPASAAASPELDAILGPWCPQLGGISATAADAVKANAAIDLVAHVVAEVTAHEIGHALGLAADTADAHHSGDSPGWIMDAGAARPFDERAGLAGAAISQWGPVDLAYLQQIFAN